METTTENGSVRTFVADPKWGKSIWKQIRKQFRRYQYGHQAICLILGHMLGTDVALFRRMEHQSQFGEILVLALAVDGLYLIAAALLRALAISGGREILMARAAESCSFTERALIIEYVPNARESAQYNRIRYTLPYFRIREVKEEWNKCRIVLYGTYEVAKYRKGENEPDTCSVVSDQPLFLYEYYPEFEGIRTRLMELKQRQFIL